MNSGFSNLIEDGEENLKVTIILSEEQMRTISAENYKDFVKKYQLTKEILESWFSNYDPANEFKILGWAGEKETKKEIFRLHREL